MKTTTETINGRTLKTGTCRGCGRRVSLWVREGEALKCLDCRDEESREKHGWTPENSRD